MNDSRIENVIERLIEDPWFSDFGFSFVDKDHFSSTTANPGLTVLFMPDAESKSVAFIECGEKFVLTNCMSRFRKGSFSKSFSKFIEGLQKIIDVLNKSQVTPEEGEEEEDDPNLPFDDE